MSLSPFWTFGFFVPCFQAIENFSECAIIESVMEKMPPKEKIYEAYSAIADSRVEMGAGRARVMSSDSSKTYTVTWEGEEYRSDDNATYWQGYSGYPVIAVLMLQGKLPFRAETAAMFSGIGWKKLNERHKRNYEAAVKEVFEALPCGRDEKERILSDTEKIYAELKRMTITVKRSKRQSSKRK